MSKFNLVIASLATILISWSFNFSLNAQAKEPEPGDNPNPEMLKDEFLYEFQGGKFTHWTAKGTLKAVLGGESNNSNTKYSAILTTMNEEGYFEQVIDLTKTPAAENGDKLKAGNEIEGLLHYKVFLGSNPAGGIRLSMQWLDAQNQPIFHKDEKKFIDNEELWFSQLGVWRPIRFRSIMPQGAVKFRFRIMINSHSMVGVDDFSFRLQSDPTPFISVLPQVLRPFEGNINTDYSQKVIMQSYHVGTTNDINLPTETIFKSSTSEIPEGDHITEFTITANAPKAGIYPRPSSANKYKSSETATFPGGIYAVALSMKAAMIDPANKPSVTIDPAEFQTIQAQGGKTMKATLKLKFGNCIDNVNIKIENNQSGFTIYPNSIPYLPKAIGNLKEGVNDRDISVSFYKQDPGYYETNLVFTSLLMDTIRYKIKAYIPEATSGYQETFAKDEAFLNKKYYGGLNEEGYHLFDLGIYHLDGATYDATTHNIIFNKANATLRFDGLFNNDVNQALLYRSDYPFGIATIALVADSKELAVDYSFDNWATLKRVKIPYEAKVNTPMIVTLDTHRPTQYRIVSLSTQPIKLTSYKIIASPESARLSFQTDNNGDIKKAITGDLNADQPQNIIRENFDEVLHNRPLIISGWRNIIISGDTPAVGVNDIPAVGSPENAAKLTLYNAKKIGSENLQAVLLSPKLSYKGAAGKTITFRIMKKLANETDLFEVGLITIKNGQITGLYALPYEQSITNFKANVWHNVHINLSKYVGIENGLPNDMDQFYFYFNLNSPAKTGGGTPTTYYIDDFSFGRTDLPVISTDKKGLQLYVKQDQQPSKPQSIVVKQVNAEGPITATLYGKKGSQKNFQMMEEGGERFYWDPVLLAKDGGKLLVRAKMDKIGKTAAYIELTARNAQPIQIMLLTTTDPKSTKELKNVYGYAVRQASDIIIRGEKAIAGVSVYDMNGKLITEKKSSEGSLEMTIHQNSKSTLILLVTYHNGDHQSIKI